MEDGAHAVAYPIFIRHGSFVGAAFTRDVRVRVRRDSPIGAHRSRARHDSPR